jgi:hypothetical protein
MTMVRRNLPPLPSSIGAESRDVTSDVLLGVGGELKSLGPLPFGAPSNIFSEVEVDVILRQ